MEIALPYGIEDARGTEVSFAGGGGGGDMLWQSYLPPGRSVRFSVPASALESHWKVFVEFEDGLRAEGPKYRTYYRYEP